MSHQIKPFVYESTYDKAKRECNKECIQCKDGKYKISNDKWEASQEAYCRMAYKQTKYEVQKMAKQDICNALINSLKKNDINLTSTKQQIPLVFNIQLSNTDGIHVLQELCETCMVNYYNQFCKYCFLLNHLFLIN